MSDAKPATFQIGRGDHETGSFQEFTTSVSEGMVVLDAVHQIQAESAPDLACRWNCHNPNLLFCWRGCTTIGRNLHQSKLSIFSRRHKINMITISTKG